MRTKFVIGACFVALLAVSDASAADNRALVGTTRDQIIARFGEPKSQIVAGSREILFFAHERVVLRDNRVIEVEDLPTEPTSPAPPPKPAPPPGQSSTTDGSDATNSDAGASPRSAPDRSGTSGPATTGTRTDAVTGNATLANPAPEPQVVIKKVRPPSHEASTSAGAPALTAPAPVTPVPAPAVSSGVSPSPVPAAPASNSNSSSGNAANPALAPTTPSSAPSVSSSAIPVQAPSTATETVAATPDASNAPTTASTEPAGNAAVPAVAPPAQTTGSTIASPSPAAKKPSDRRRIIDAPIPAEEDSVFTWRTYLLALVIIGGGIGYLYWRSRQRALLLAATAVSRSPFAPEALAASPAAAAAGARFTSDLLNKLEWKRFEELVAAYYNKTGVVAARSKSGPMAPVHIRISWKGEQRPFACVQCHAHPSALIEAKPIQALVDVLGAEDIRRGYVVSSGKFAVPARDLAEEKHITLLPGDIFLEKLNALPEPARAELLRDATTGDYTTPSCPTCETKMVRGDSGWQCAQCGTTLPR